MASGFTSIRGKRAEEDKLEQLIVRQRRGPGFAQPRAQPLAMPVIVPGRVLVGLGRHRIGARSAPVGDRVKISQPVSVTPTVCSNWAESDRSRVTAVQPSDKIFTP